MIVFLFICFAFIASTSCQVSQSPPYYGPGSNLINSGEFKRYLTLNGLRPLQNFNPNQVSNKPEPDPSKILATLQQDFENSRKELYHSVGLDLSALVEDFRKSAVEWAEHFSEFVMQQIQEKGNATLNQLDNELNDRYASVVSKLMVATDRAVENYNENTAATNQKLERKLKELKDKTRIALEGADKVLAPNHTENGGSLLTDLNGDPINLLEGMGKKLNLPEI